MYCRTEFSSQAAFVVHWTSPNIVVRPRNVQRELILEPKAVLKRGALIMDHELVVRSKK